MTIGESYHEPLFWFCGNLKGNHIFPHFSIQCRVCVIHALILAKIGFVSPMLWMAPQKRANFWSCRCVVELANPHATTLHQCKTPHDQQLFGSTQMNFKSWSHTWTTLRNQHEGELGNLKDLKRDQETKRPRRVVGTTIRNLLHLIVKLCENRPRKWNSVRRYVPGWGFVLTCVL